MVLLYAPCEVTPPDKWKNITALRCAAKKMGWASFGENWERSTHHRSGIIQYWRAYSLGYIIVADSMCLTSTTLT